MSPAEAGTVAMYCYLYDRFELGSGPAVLTSTVPVDDGFPHTVVVER